MNSMEMIEIEATVERYNPKQVWLYRKPDSLWTVLKLVQQDYPQKFIAKGVLKFEPRHGDRLKLVGCWKKSEFNGNTEFSFVRCELDIPTDPRAALDYAAQITKGVGPSLRDQIWARYGEQWTDHPDLDGVTGISETVRSAWRETLRRLALEQAKTRTLSFLLGKNVSLTLATRAWERWKESTISRVAANPYCLTELPRVGFLTIENAGIPQAFGIEDDDPRRIRAAILYAMEDLTPRYGTLIPIVVLAGHAALVSVAKHIENAVSQLVEDGELVLLGDHVALRRDYEADARIVAYAQASEE